MTYIPRRIAKPSLESDNKLYALRKHVNDWRDYFINSHKSTQILEISPSEDIKQAESKNKNYTSTDFPEFDLCNPSKNFLALKSDLVLCFEVLEHTQNPFKAADTLSQLTRQEGTCVVSTPFAFREHGPYPDNWRFTSNGLKTLFRPYFKYIEIKTLEDFNNPLAPIHHVTILRHEPSYIS